MASKHWAQKWLGWAPRARSKSSPGLCEMAAVVLLEAAQEMIERTSRLDVLGCRELRAGPRSGRSPVAGRQPVASDTAWVGWRRSSTARSRISSASRLVASRIRRVEAGPPPRPAPLASHSIPGRPLPSVSWRATRAAGQASTGLPLDQERRIAASAWRLDWRIAGRLPVDSGPPNWVSWKKAASRRSRNWR